MHIKSMVRLLFQSVTIVTFGYLLATLITRHLVPTVMDIEKSRSDLHDTDGIKYVESRVNASDDKIESAKTTGAWNNRLTPVRKVISQAFSANTSKALAVSTNTTSIRNNRLTPKFRRKVTTEALTVNTSAAHVPNDSVKTAKQARTNEMIVFPVDATNKSVYLPSPSGVTVDNSPDSIKTNPSSLKQPVQPLLPSSEGGWSWFRTEGSMYMFLYTGFYDERETPALVRVVALMPMKYNFKKLQCVCRTRAGAELKSKILSVRSNDLHSAETSYKVAFINCEYPRVQGHDISDVILSDTTTKDSASTRVTYPTRPSLPSEYKYNFTICLQPLHHHFGSMRKELQNVIEFLEITSALGASNFVLYPLSVDRRAANLFEHYPQIQIRNFSLPMLGGKPVNVWSNGQLLTLIDCFYNYMWTSKYVVSLDFDETIVPMKDKTWDDMIQNVIKLNPNCGDFTQMNFRHALFHPDYCHKHQLYKTGRTYQAFRDKYPTFEIRRLECVIRGKEMEPELKRSKYIANPRSVVYPGIHLVHQFMPTVSDGAKNNSCPTLSVNASEAYLFHHRLTGKKVKKPPSETSVETRMWNFEQILTQRISQKVEKLKGVLRKLKIIY